MSKIYSAGCDYHRRLCREGGETLKCIDSLPDDVILASSGWFHNLFYSPSKGWFGGGANAPESGPRLIPIPSLNEIKPIWMTCGDNHSAVVDEEGDLYIFSGSVNPNPSKVELPSKVRFASMRLNKLVVIPEGNGIYFFPEWGSSPKFILSNYTFIDAAVGEKSCLCLTSEHRLFAWGDESSGTGDTNSTFNNPIEVNVNCTVERVFCGSYNSYLIDSEGHVWASGRNGDGQCGFGRNSTSRFTKVPPFSNSPIVSISGGHYIAYALNADGEIFACGKGEFHALLLPDQNNRNIFTKCTEVQGLHFTFMTSGCYHLVCGTGEFLSHPILNNAHIKRRRRLIVLE